MIGEKEMASIKETFSKGITTINVKTNNFMEQNKIKTYISTLEKDISSLYNVIGEKIYEAWKNENVEISCVEEQLKEITEKYKEIEAQNQKLEQILIEERQILVGTQTDTLAQNRIFCSQCGAENDSAYKFCVKCGRPLK